MGMRTPLRSSASTTAAKALALGLLAWLYIYIALRVNSAGTEGTRTSGIARLLPLQTYVAGVGGLHHQCMISLQARG